MKHIKRFLITLACLACTFIIVNANTRFFKDIGETFPFLSEHFPNITAFISDASDSLNKTLSHIPSPKELIAKITGSEVKISPDDVAYNTYYTSDTMLNFYADKNYCVSVTGGIMSIYGTLKGSSERFLVYHFLDSDKNLLLQETDETDSDGNFAKNLKIPENTRQLAIFTGSERYGQYVGQVFDYIYLTQNNGEWELESSPVFDANVTEYEKAKSKSDSLKNTYSVCCKEKEIIDLANQITVETSDDYEKAAKIYKWVCENIYYDSDSITDSSSSAPYVASDVLTERRAVCLGYANLYAALCRSQGIPCKVVTGYALGIMSGDSEWTEENIATKEANHAWNEVYVGNRWVIADPTWGSKNRVTNGIRQTDGNISYLYFDANLKFFSTNHKIIAYEK